MAWQIDSSHSHVNFTARHMMISKVRGAFENFSGTVNFDEANPTNTTVNIEVDLSSINTRDAQRDGHLQSPDFFDVATHPTMTFVSTRVEQVDENNGRLYGQLTIKAVPDPEPGTVLDHEEVLETGKQIIPKLTALLRGILQQL